MTHNEVAKSTFLLFVKDVEESQIDMRTCRSNRTECIQLDYVAAHWLDILLSYGPLSFTSFSVTYGIFVCL